MIPRGMRLGLLLAAASSPALPQVPEAQEYLGRAVTCCFMGDCQKLETFVWRRTDYGVDIMISNEDWCPVRLRYFPLTRAFNGLPTNVCDLLACFPSELFKSKSLSWKRDELPPGTRIRMRP
jgi:hypothetical protein